MKKFALGMVLLTVALSAEEGIDFEGVSQESGLDLVAKTSKPDKKMKKKKDGEEKKPSITCDSYESTQGPFVSGEFLYWKAHSSRMPVGAIAVLAPAGGGSVSQITKKVIDVRFGYDPGYRVGLGYRIPYRGWDVLGNWTHFQTTGKRGIDAKAANQAVQQILGDDIFIIHAPNRISAHNHIHLNTFDFELGKMIHFVPSFGMRPFVGFKLAWVDEHLKVDQPQSSPNTISGGAAFLKFYNDFQGVGLRTGINTDWEIDKGFAVLAKAAYSLLWGKLDTKRKDEYITTQGFGSSTLLSLDYTFPEHHHVILSAIELFAGARWEICYNQKKRFRFRIQGGYEAQYWPGFNQLNAITSGTGATTLTPFTGDLGFHGWTIGTRFDF